jgi:hypothetical protein
MNWKGYGRKRCELLIALSQNFPGRSKENHKKGEAIPVTGCGGP